MKTVSGLMLTLLLLGMLTLAFNIQPVRASGTIYIKADGSIEGTTHISSADNVTYTFTDNIYDEIVVEIDNIVIDGAGYTLQGTGAWDSKGIDLTERSNVTIKNTEIKAFDYGIWLDWSSNNTISGNDITANNEDGIYLDDYSNYNTVSGNTVTANDHGIGLHYSSSYNTITGNTATNNGKGISLWESSNNHVSGNNITANNDKGIELSYSSHNTISGNNMTNNGEGIWLAFSSNNTITGNTATNNDRQGIRLSDSSNYNTISGNTATNNSQGIMLSTSSNLISGNIVTNNSWGIDLEESSSNTITGNTVASNYKGIWLDDSSNNLIYHNNFMNNTQQVYIPWSGYANFWDDGYPSGGNYWSDYEEIYPDAEELDGSGIWDTPYFIDENNQDNYPLMGPISFFDAGTWNDIAYCVDVASNSTVSDFYFNPDEGAFLCFNVTGPQGTTGFCRVVIPKELLWVEDGQWTILVGGEPVEYVVIPDENCTYICFTYSHTTKTVEIIGTNAVPEFPTWKSMLLILILLSIAIAIYKRRLLKTPIH